MCSISPCILVSTYDADGETGAYVGEKGDDYEEGFHGEGLIVRSGEEEVFIGFWDGCCEEGEEGGVCYVH